MKFSPQELLRESNRLDLIACQRLRLLQLEIKAKGLEFSRDPSADYCAAGRVIELLEERMRRNCERLESIAS